MGKGEVFLKSRKTNFNTQQSQRYKSKLLLNEGLHGKNQRKQGLCMGGAKLGKARMVTAYSKERHEPFNITISKST